MSGGSTGYLTSSCNGVHACRRLGYYGTAGNVKDSCNSDYSCKGVAFDIGGSIGDILSSCNNEDACKGAGYDVNSVITSSLNNCCSTIVSECEGASEATLPAQCEGVVSDYLLMLARNHSACTLLLVLLWSCWWLFSNLVFDSLNHIPFTTIRHPHPHRPNDQSWHLSQERPRRQRRHRLQLRLLLPRRPKCRSRSQWRMKIYSIKVRGVFSGPVNVKNVVLRDESMILPLRYCCCVTSCDLHISGGGGGGG